MEDLQKLDNKYESIIANYTDTQLLYERVIVLEEYNTVRKKLALLDEEYKRRLRK